MIAVTWLRPARQSAVPQGDDKVATTITGSAGPDRLASPGDRSVRDQGGEVLGLGGDDTLASAGGADTLDGGDGFDIAELDT